MKYRDITRMCQHPLNSKRKLRSVFRYFLLGFRMKFARNMFSFNILGDVKILVGKESTSSILQYLNGLNDFEEMSLVLHFLNSEDLFVDVGANVGVYSILSSGYTHAKSIAIEPSNSALQLLRKNIEMNSLEAKIEVIETVVGQKEGTVLFTNGLDAINRVKRNEDKNVEVNSVKMNSLDDVLKKKCPSLLKIDVEGFELNVINGATETLKNQDLNVILIETNGLSKKYNFNDKDIYDALESYGFKNYRYIPFERKLVEVDFSKKTDNSIFIRDLKKVEEKISKSVNININGLSY